MNVVWIVMPILLVLMFDLGLTLSLSDFTAFLKKPLPVIAGVVGQMLVLPIVAFVLCLLFRPNPVFFVGVMLVACSPGGSSSNVFSRLVGGDVALSVSLTAMSSILSVFSIPLIIALSARFAGFHADKIIDIPIGKLFIQNIVLMLLPVCVGILLKSWRPKVALNMDRVLSKIAFPALMLLALLFFLQHRKVIADNVIYTGSILLALILSAMAVGEIISRIMRLDLSSRRTILIEVGMQNAAQAIALATSPFVFDNQEMAVPAILYALIMNIVLLIYVAVCKIRNSK